MPLLLLLACTRITFNPWSDCVLIKLVLLNLLRLLISLKFAFPNTLYVMNIFPFLIKYVAAKWINLCVCSMNMLTLLSITFNYYCWFDFFSYKLPIIIIVCVRIRNRLMIVCSYRLKQIVLLACTVVGFNWSSSNANIICGLAGGRRETIDNIVDKSQVEEFRLV